MKIFLSTVLGVLIAGQIIAQQVIKLWETQAVLDVPESVLCDDSVVYVSCVNGNPADKDNNGYIARLATDGKIMQQHWFDGLHAPKGMAVHGALLYVSDIDRVAVIARDKGKLLQFIDISGTKFLNDVTVSGQGVVAVSDMSDQAIYLIKGKKAELLLKNEKLDHVNGLYWEKNTLYVGVANAILAVDIETRNVTTVVENTGGIDGLERFEGNRFLISDWKGKVQVVGPDVPPVEVLNVAAEKYNAADIDYSAKTHILFIPTFFGNSVAAYRVE
jgi:hypothetical protein